MGYKEIKTVNYVVGIWQSNPTEDVWGISKKERETAGKVALIKHLFPNEFCEWGYEESGKPYFINRPENLSFSHSEDIYVCQISDTILCGIDVQHYREKILRVPDKFLNSQELDFINTVDEEEKLKSLTAMWSCKEALYKMYGKGFIDYVNQFTIQPFQPATGILEATADLGNGKTTYYFHVKFTDKYVLAFHSLSPFLPTDE